MKSESELDRQRENACNIVFLIIAGFKVQIQVILHHRSVRSGKSV